MTVTIAKPYSGSRYTGLSAALTRFVNSHDLSPNRDMIVHVFGPEEDGWADLPVAWHRPSGSDIVINLGMIFSALERDIFTHDFAGSTTINEVRCPSHTTMGKLLSIVNDFTPANEHLTKYETYTSKGDISNRHVIADHHNLSYMLGRGHRGHSLPETLSKILLGVIVHETGHSVFSPFIIAPWYNALDGYGQQIIMMFEELRCEYQQILRIGTGREMLRASSDVVVNPQIMASDLNAAIDADGKISVAALALHSTLVLGRTLYKVFLDYEVKELRNTVISVVGDDRYDEMTRIWHDYALLTEIDPDEMRDLVRRWKELFPDGGGVTSKIAIVVVVASRGEETDDSDGMKSEDESGTKIILVVKGEDEGDKGDEDGEGSGKGPGDDEKTEEGEESGSASGSDDSDGEDQSDADAADGSIPEHINHGYSPHGGEKVKLPSLVEVFKRTTEQAISKALVTVGHDDHNHPPGGLTRPDQALKKMRRPSQDQLQEPTPECKSMAKKLSTRLRNLSVTGVHKFKVSDPLPPGRLRGRAAMQRVAQKSRGQIPTAEPWERKKRVVEVNPPLICGIATDVSGSQGWATHFSAMTAWIVARAVHQVNGKAAAVTYGSVVTVTLEPGEIPKKVTVIPANAGHEVFDQAMATLDGLLNLKKGRGVRVVFIVGDGYHVKGGEMAKTQQWCQDLIKAGVAVVWVTPNAPGDRYMGVPCLPENVIGIHVDRGVVAADPTQAIDRVAEAIERAIKRVRGSEERK